MIDDKKLKISAILTIITVAILSAEFCFQFPQWIRIVLAIILIINCITVWNLNKEE